MSSEDLLSEVQKQVRETRDVQRERDNVVGATALAWQSWILDEILGGENRGRNERLKPLSRTIGPFIFENRPNLDPGTEIVREDVAKLSFSGVRNGVSGNYAASIHLLYSRDWTQHGPSGGRPLSYASLSFEFVYIVMDPSGGGKLMEVADQVSVNEFFSEAKKSKNKHERIYIQELKMAGLSPVSVAKSIVDGSDRN